MRNPMVISVLVLLAVTSFMDNVSFSKQISVPKFKCRVQLSVTADENIKSRLQSYLEGELRSLGDISLVDDEPDYEIFVVGMTSYNTYNDIIGYSIGTTITKPFKKDTFLIILQSANVTPNVINTFDMLTKNLSKYCTTMINTDSDLKRISEKITATFNSDYVEAERKGHREIYEGVVR